MRIAGIVALALLSPALAYAADPPALMTYTLSQDTIYPSASSGLATTTVIDIAFSEAVKASIKIVSSSGGLIKSLYTSSSVTNPAPKTWDGTNSAGARAEYARYTILISATSTATGAVMTDSSKTITVASSDPGVPSESSSESSDAPRADDALPASSGGGSPEYIPIPILRIMTAGNRTVTSGADTAFAAVVYDSKGNRRDDALVTWSFGDGMRRTGASVLHAFYEPGEYAVIVHAKTSDGGDTTVVNAITAKDLSVKISAISARGITLVNNGTRPIDLSLWRLTMGGQEFKIPEDTQILAGRSVLFPTQIIQLPAADTASLLYPSGEIAATYPAAVSVKAPELLLQPSSRPVSYSRGKTVEAVISQPNAQSYENAVGAPAATTELAAAGAALPPAEPVKARGSGLFRSPWTLGLLGVIAVAGGAFILL